MPKSKAIVSAALGLALSTILPACAPSADRRPARAAVAVPVSNPAPAELLACAERPKGFPADAAALLPKPVRDALARLARAFGANADRQDRLINWNAPGSCPREVSNG